MRKHVETEGGHMQGIGIDFSWAQFPDYHVEEEPLALSGMMGPALIGQGNPLVTRPLEQFPELYLRLAGAELTLAGHKAFARK
jgi:hypothetical protein